MFFAATIAALGIVGMIQGGFTQTWSGVPKGFPAREALAYLCALVSLATGIGLLWRRAAVLASRALLTCLLLWLVLFRISHIFLVPTILDTWWGCGDTAVMAAGAWALYARLAGGDRGLRLAGVLFGLAMIPFGVAHFTSLQDTAGLVPGWLPWHEAWASFTGAAFLAAGVAILIGVCARPAAVLSAVQMGLFTLLAWVPAIAAGPNAFQWSEFVDSWALTAGAWMVADSYRGDA
ncbi:MAG TPA: hypothetical protein VE404_08130 [Verrucomicrobiae bacterium]|nr:hypothetical protein [Verrucomicrobiae bacterium]